MPRTRRSSGRRRSRRGETRVVRRRHPARNRRNNPRGSRKVRTKYNHTNMKYSCKRTRRVGGMEDAQTIISRRGGNTYSYTLNIDRKSIPGTFESENGQVSYTDFIAELEKKSGYNLTAIYMNIYNNSNNKDGISELENAKPIDSADPPQIIDVRTQYKILEEQKETLQKNKDKLELEIQSITQKLANCPRAQLLINVTLRDGELINISQKTKAHRGSGAGKKKTNRRNATFLGWCTGHSSVPDYEPKP